MPDHAIEQLFQLVDSALEKDKKSKLIKIIVLVVQNLRLYKKVRPFIIVKLNEKYKEIRDGCRCQKKKKKKNYQVALYTVTNASKRDIT